jgi:hypothetical protein
MSPILTARAIRLTPKQGSKPSLNSTPTLLPAFLASHAFKTVHVPAIEEEPKITPEDAL